MNGCYCLCYLHRSFTVVCRGEEETTAVIRGRVASAVALGMCKPCALWWEQSSPHEVIAAKREAYFDSAAFYRAITTAMRERGVSSQRQVQRQAGLRTSTLTNIKYGAGINADTLVRLMRWMGRTDLDPFISYRDVS